MKKLVFLSLSLISLSLLLFQFRLLETPPQNSPSGAAFTWEQTQYDFGKIKQGTPVEYRFQFKNSGESPLILKEVKTSCGCTASEWSREAIQPGASGEIKVQYNAARAGRFHKTIRVLSNLEEEITLSIEGEVLPE